MITPNLDRLAETGVRFSNAYTQNTICTPSRVSNLSGQYCHNHGYYGLSGPTPERLPSYLHHFKKVGYRTAGIGKLHLPDDPVNWIADAVDLYADGYYPQRQGQPLEEAPYARYLQKHGILHLEDSSTLWAKHLGKEPSGWDARPSEMPFEHNVENWCVDQAVEFMNNSDESPFCIHVSLPRPHHQLTPDQRFWDMYPDDIELPESYFYDEGQGRPPHFQKMQQKLADYSWPYQPDDHLSGLRRVYKGTLACVTQVDHAVGRLLDFLEQSGLADNTIVIYNTDHGCFHGLYGLPEKKPGISSEAVCRIPTIWRIPGIADEGKVENALVESVDMAPTLAALTGTALLEWTDGKDMTPLLKGEVSSLREVAVTENVWSRSIRWGPWRYVHYPAEMFDGEHFDELYNIENDPHEQHNLINDPDHSQTVEQCRRRLLDWLITTLRVTTAHPGWKRNRHPDVRLAEDGKESNQSGAWLRKKKGQILCL